MQAAYRHTRLVAMLEGFRSIHSETISGKLTYCVDVDAWISEPFVGTGRVFTYLELEVNAKWAQFNKAFVLGANFEHEHPRG